MRSSNTFKLLPSFNDNRANEQDRKAFDFLNILVIQDSAQPPDVAARACILETYGLFIAPIEISIGPTLTPPFRDTVFYVAFGSSKNLKKYRAGVGAWQNFAGVIEAQMNVVWKNGSEHRNRFNEGVPFVAKEGDLRGLIRCDTQICTGFAGNYVEGSRIVSAAVGINLKRLSISKTWH
jgi:hypothetical protein